MNNVAERFREVRKQLGFTQDDLAKRLLLSRNYIAKIETNAKAPSARVLTALEALIVDRGHTARVEEGAQSYRKAGSRSAAIGLGKGSPSERMLNPKHSPENTPTRQDIEEHVRQYLDMAVEVPGAIAHAYIEITEALPLERLRRRLEQLRS